MQLAQKLVSWDEKFIKTHHLITEDFKMDKQLLQK